MPHDLHGEVIGKHRARTMVESIWTSQSMSPAVSAWAWSCCGARVNTGP
ncbi:hypothetical protein V2J94_40555 [Streptomyces sp. DSM 41524]|uniref:Transposase n=1 Tax=Streptomyces asiaticus subsp. ignotus TaxID=3098222 RepID=A0ABU7Q9K3_9ACTN|nr:hypothetical protein [Streptomyces sp. DSM 41524]